MDPWNLMIVLLAYGVPITWGVMVLVRLTENRTLLKRISEDIAALRAASDRGESIRG